MNGMVKIEKEMVCTSRKVQNINLITGKKIKMFFVFYLTISFLSCISHKGKTLKERNSGISINFMDNEYVKLQLGNKISYLKYKNLKKYYYIYEDKNNKFCLNKISFKKDKKIGSKLLKILLFDENNKLLNNYEIELIKNDTSKFFISNNKGELIFEKSFNKIKLPKFINKLNSKISILTDSMKHFNTIVYKFGYINELQLEYEYVKKKY